MCSSKDIFVIIQKWLIFNSKLNSSIAAFAMVESEMSQHAGQEKNVLFGQIMIAKVTRERAQVFLFGFSFIHNIWSLYNPQRTSNHTIDLTSGAMGH